MIDLRLGDCRVVLAEMPECSVDAIVTDPPAGIAFMNKHWDKNKGGRDEWIAWMTEIMTECLRVAKPGAYALVWALPRTSHWTAMAIEDAGWRINTKIYHLFGSGFPKSHDISKALDRMAGAEREVLGRRVRLGDSKDYDTTRSGGTWQGNTGLNDTGTITAPATDLARQWQGFGTQLKPAAEEWILAQKPLEGTYAANVARWGVGALNIDRCRVGTTDSLVRPFIERHDNEVFGRGLGAGTQVQPAGRWPSNVVLQHAPECRQVGTRRLKYIGGKPNTDETHTNTYGWADGGGIYKKGSIPADADGLETVESWICAEGCAVAELDRQSGERPGGYRQNPSFADSSDSVTGWNHGWRGERGYDDGGSGASRFFYVAKASRADRELGLERFEVAKVNDGRDTPIDNPYQRGETQRKNTHPTVKPTELMRYLVKLITPPQGTVLDPFCGSGSTGVAAMLEGFDFIGVEMEPEYLRIAQARIEAAAAIPRQHTLDLSVSPPRVGKET